jgi:ssDNA-binding Zn-finger/Zn-ribbon topoisomerase 1
MYLFNGDERSTALETSTHDGLRRRRRRGSVDVQSARCPRCGQQLVVFQGADGPAYHCGCGRRRSAPTVVSKLLG